MNVMKMNVLCQGMPKKQLQKLDAGAKNMKKGIAASQIGQGIPDRKISCRPIPGCGDLCQAYSNGFREQPNWALPVPHNKLLLKTLTSRDDGALLWQLHPSCCHETNADEQSHITMAEIPQL